jgi:hypothetical protein
MTDWMDDLNEEIQKLAEEKQNQKLNRQNEDNKIGQLTYDIYEHILKRVNEDRWQVKSKLLTDVRENIELNYPENTINIGEFWLDISNYRYKVKLNSKENRIDVSMIRYDHPQNRNPRVTGNPRWNTVNDGSYDFSITTDTKRIFTETKGVRQLEENIDLVIQKLFGNLVKAFKLDE